MRQFDQFNSFDYTSAFSTNILVSSLNPKFCFYVIDKMNDNNTIHLYDYKRKMVPTSITEKMIRYLWINSYYQINELIFYFLILPIVLFYFILGVILLISFCVITIKYVQVCQWYIIDQCFNRVNKKVRKNDKNKIYSLNRITKPMVQICSSIGSLYFKQSSAFEKYFFIIFAIFDAIVLTYFIQECTKITRNNTKIEYKLRCYLLKLLWSRKTSSQLKFKWNCFIMNPRLEKCGFTFWNHWLIDSNCYLFAFYIITFTPDVCRQVSANLYCFE
ncbi:hypothetical protein BLOT_012463 [Blomia tropicalis]|nr:hypothetical protein BLOT_012463 [Blomia tropicalis]